MKWNSDSKSSKQEQKEKSKELCRRAINERNMREKNVSKVNITIMQRYQKVLNKDKYNRNT